MVSPTPASAYARGDHGRGRYLSLYPAGPGLRGAALLAAGLMVLGGGTMLYGGCVALRQRDLKLFRLPDGLSARVAIALLIGCGNPVPLLGGLAVLIAHATFKAPLFFAVGIIDTSTGTRDLTELSGLGKAAVPWPRWRRWRRSDGRHPADHRLRGQRRPAVRSIDGGGYGVVGTVGAMALWLDPDRRLQRSVPLGAFADKPVVKITDPRPASAWMPGRPCCWRSRPGARHLPALSAAAAVLCATAGPDPRGRNAHCRAD